MALRVWLPLNGNINNYGISDVTVTNNGATVDSNGKIGKCYNFNGSSAKMSTPIDLTPEMSFCVWVKFNSVQNFVIDARNSSGYGYQPMYISSTGVQIYSSGSPSGGYVNYSFSTDIWYHIVVSYSNNKGYLYVNGTLVGTVGVASLTLNNSILTIGSRYSSQNYLNGKLNDIRIYDHALSPKEVKEISKGLCLHYKLAGPGRPNLLSYQKIVKQSNVSLSYDPNTLTFTTKTPTTATCYGIRMSTDNCIIPWNHVGIMSMDILSPVATTFYRDDNDYAVSGNSWSGNDNTSRGSVVTAIPANKWTKIIIYSINNSSLNTNHESVKVQSSFNINTADVEFKFKNVKFEVSSISTDRNVTPWCPASDDTLYAALGYNNNIEDDCSGFSNNGTNSGVTIEATSGRYSSSYKYSNNNSTTNVTPCFPSGQTQSELTTSIWFKTNTLNSTCPNLVSLGENNFWRFRLASATSIWAYIRVGSTQVAITLSVPSSITSSLIDNQWHFCAVSFKEGIITIYVDGVSIGTYNASSTAKYITCGASGSTWHLAGYTSTSESFIGNLSDFRIYATALSAADILELYESSGAVDSHYNSYAYELIEE